MKTLSFWATLLFIFISFSATAQFNKFKVGEKFNVDVIRGSNGEEQKLNSLGEKVIVLNFWDKYCRGCIQEIPYLNTLYQDYQGKDIMFLSITSHTEKEIKDFLVKHPIDWELTTDVDFEGKYGDTTFEIECLPTTIVIDKEGIVQHSFCAQILDGVSGRSFRKILDKALE